MAYDQETLNILKGLQTAQPTTQQVDYSGFMNDFQPVQNYPNYFVPQQGLLQNTPTLNTLSDLDVMQQRPQNLLNMIDQYPTLENDFQRSFAVNPDTFNMGVYKPLPYDADYWNSFATQAGGTTGGDDTLGAVIGGGLLASKLLGGDDTIDGSTNTTTTTTTGSDDGNDTIDGGTKTITGVDSVITGGTGNDTIDGGSNNLTTVSSIIGGTGNDVIEIDDSGSNVVEVSNIAGSTGANIISNTTAGDSVTTKTSVTDTDLNTAKNDAINTLLDAADIAIKNGTMTGADLDDAENAIKTSTSIANVSSVLSSTLTNAGMSTINVSSAPIGGTNLLTSKNSSLPTNTITIDLTNNNTGGLIGGSLKPFNVDIEGDIIQNTGNAFTKFMNNPISDKIPVTGDQLLTGAGTLLALDQVIKDAKPSNVTAAIAGGAKLAGYTNPYTAPLIAGLTIAEELAPPDSGKTGSGAFDYNTSTNTDFGMAGDKFKQGHVDTASTISQGIGTAINTIADGYGLNVEGDHLVEFGRERPLSLSFGDQETEQTADNRLNYSAETGDITNSTDTMKRFYYTGTDGNDATALADNVIKGTNLLSLKAIANGEDTINMQDFRLPARSADDVKNIYLLKGFDETTAEELTNAARGADPATSELLGGLLIGNTDNEDLFLTNTEKTSLLEQGYTEEQLNEILYG